MKLIASPPDNFDTLSPKLDPTTDAQVLYRFNKVGHSSCLYFSKKKEFRFDDPDREFGVFYAAVTPDAAFAQTYGHDVSTMPQDVAKVLSEHELKLRNVFKIQTKGLRLAMFFDGGLSTLKLDANICVITDYDIPQQWARWTYHHPNKFDGIVYHARHLPSVKCVALFESARDKIIEEENLSSVLDFRHPQSGKTIYDILDDQDWAVVP